MILISLVSLVLNFSFLVGFLVRFAQSRVRAYLYLATALLLRLVSDVLVLYLTIERPVNHFTQPVNDSVLDIGTTFNIVLGILTLLSSLLFILVLLFKFRDWLHSMHDTQLISGATLNLVDKLNLGLIVLFVLATVMSLVGTIVNALYTLEKSAAIVNLVVEILQLLVALALTVIQVVCWRGVREAKTPGEVRKRQQIFRLMAISILILISYLLGIIFERALFDLLMELLVMYLCDFGEFALLLFPADALVGYEIPPGWDMPTAV